MRRGATSAKLVFADLSADTYCEIGIRFIPAGAGNTPLLTSVVFQDLRFLQRSKIRSNLFMALWLDSYMGHDSQI